MSTTPLVISDEIPAAPVHRRPGPFGPGVIVDRIPAAGRMELKYCVPALVSESVLDVARAYLVPDALAVSPRQCVTSLYLDTPELTFLRWHRERAGDRFKLRIRRYGELPAQTLYAELKRKTGSVVHKRRAAFTAKALLTVLEGSGVPNSATSPQDAKNLGEFARRRWLSGATPKMLVTCVRESLRDPDDETAVTVDRALRYQPTHRADLIGDARAWQPIPLRCASGPATALVELKYGLRPPAWMDALTVQLAPWRVSFSKYVAAMNECAADEIC
jgi:hypothetical protein